MGSPLGAHSTVFSVNKDVGAEGPQEPLLISHTMAHRPGWGLEGPGRQRVQECSSCCLPTLLVPSGTHSEERAKNYVEKTVQLAFFITNLKTQTQILTGRGLDE